jgi:hypothetical protein
MRAAEVFAQQNGEVTKTYYAEMNAKGSLGELGVALFRAQKRSTAAKRYRGGRFTRAAYDVKNWSLSEITSILLAHPGMGLTWGWKEDPNTPGFEWVLYVDLPQGQCSFHSAGRGQGPDYPKDWDKSNQGRERIIAFCDSVAGEAQPGPVAEPPEKTEREGDECQTNFLLF